LRLNVLKGLMDDFCYAEKFLEVAANDALKLQQMRKLLLELVIKIAKFF